MNTKRVNANIRRSYFLLNLFIVSAVANCATKIRTDSLHSASYRRSPTAHNVNGSRSQDTRSGDSDVCDRLVDTRYIYDGEYKCILGNCLTMGPYTWTGDCLGHFALNKSNTCVDHHIKLNVSETFPGYTLDQTLIHTDNISKRCNAQRLRLDWNTDLWLSSSQKEANPLGKAMSKTDLKDPCQSCN